MRSEIWAGEMIKAGKLELVPFARVFRLRLPFTKNFRVVWNRPAALMVYNGPDRDAYIPIVDVTRRWQVGILLAGLLISSILWLGSRKKDG